MVTFALCALLIPFAGDAKKKPKKKGKKKAEQKVRELPPRVKIYDIDTRQAPLIKIYATFLSRQNNVVKIKKLDRLQVVYQKGRSATEDVLREFIKGQIIKGQRGSIKTFGKSKVKLGVVVVAAGHGDEDLKSGRMGQMQRDGLGLIFKKLGKQDIGQIIWYNDKLRVYSTAKEKELSDYTVARCRKIREDKEKKKKDELQSKFPISVCAPTSKLQDIAKAIKEEKYTGRHPKLLGAIETAVEMLIRTPEMPRQKVIIILTDGKMGDLHQLDEFRDRLRDAQMLGTRKRSRRRGKSRRRRRRTRTVVTPGIKLDYKATIKLIENEIKGFYRQNQARWILRLRKLIPLCKAANIRVFVVGYPTGTRAELLPLKVLAFKTGGTYRETLKLETLEADYEQVVKEISDSYVIEFNSRLKGNKPYTLRLKVRAGGDDYKTPKYTFMMPVLPGGLIHWVKGKWLWLQSKVGYTLALIIVIAALLLITIILLLLIKKILSKIWEKTGKKMLDKAKKDAATAGKAAAKGK